MINKAGISEFGQVRRTSGGTLSKQDWRPLLACAAVGTTLAVWTSTGTSTSTSSAAEQKRQAAEQERQSATQEQQAAAPEQQTAAQGRQTTAPEQQTATRERPPATQPQKPTAQERQSAEQRRQATAQSRHAAPTHGAVERPSGRAGATGTRSPHGSPSGRLRQQAVERTLRANGIRWRSNGRCSDRERTDCTSFEGIRPEALNGLIDFKHDSGCPVVISGGTERGHASGPYSHAEGYKIDLMPSRCTDRHITRHYRYAGKRSDGAELYRAPTADVYAREDSHWDITFR
ncbi:hypothetical protein SMC26_31860 [Actinomadura fulvescens]|uniref:hypothetical protein n=1 Tax=Actinomadura fulvescens TaxID=46160 RepID=UPI0031D3C818